MEYLQRQGIGRKFSICTFYRYCRGWENISGALFYNLDVVIFVGYRVNSKQATVFRIWATAILKKYLVDGYAINVGRWAQTEQKFKELQETIVFLQTKSARKNLKGQEGELLSLLSYYASSLAFLDQYDRNVLPAKKGKKNTLALDYEYDTYRQH